MNSQTFSVIICAAGQSSRMKGTDKMTFLLDGKTVCDWAIDAFLAYPHTKQVVVALPADQLKGNPTHPDGRVRYCAGGATRQETVLRAAACLEPCDLIAVHDGARPFVRPELIDEVCRAAAGCGAAFPALPLIDTVHVVKDGAAVQTPDRRQLVAAQTPQIFTRDAFDAVLCALASGRPVTDECSAAIACGIECRFVSGDRENLKITTPEDLQTAARIAAKHRPNGQTDKKEQPFMRIGHGYDVHRICEGRALVLGGVTLDAPFGLDGHSDADVLTHAVIDALLGAAALGDIGQMFPDTDPRFRGISSLILLRTAYEAVCAAGYRLNNLDATILCQRPKLAPAIPEMRKKLAQTMHVPLETVSVKATTEEKLGFTGRGEGISAHAVCLLTAEKTDVPDAQAQGQKAGP